MRGQRENASLRENAAAWCATEGNLLEVVVALRFEGRKSIILREAVVHEGVVAVQKLQHAAVVLEDVLKVELGLPHHVVGDSAAEVREAFGIRRHQSHVSKLEPLAG